MDSTWVPWVSLTIALLALTINGWTFWDRRRLDRRDMFMKLHEAMLAPELQRGRLIIYRRCGSEEAVKKLSDEDVDAFLLANRAVAMFDLMALYVETGHIKRSDALEEWGYSTSNLLKAARYFLEYRSAEAGRQACPYFVSFAESAMVWRASNPR